jgi:RNA polymerase sigma-70 factor (ECF subfamily)
VTDPDDARRFAAMYGENRSRVYAYAVSKAGRQLADEIVSEVFLVGWRRLADVPDPPLPWLLAVARNVASSQLRAGLREHCLAAEMRAWTTESELTVGDVADQVAERLAVLTALASLTEPDRELLTLVAWHGLTPSVAARVVGCSTATYFVRLHRARRRLERALDIHAGRVSQPGPASQPGLASQAGLASPAGQRDVGCPAERQQVPAGQAEPPSAVLRYQERRSR